MPHFEDIPSQTSSVLAIDYDAYLQYKATKQSTIASTAQAGHSIACLTHSSPLGLWILDYGASDHISSNKQLL